MTKNMVKTNLNCTYLQIQSCRRKPQPQKINLNQGKNKNKQSHSRKIKRWVNPYTKNNNKKLYESTNTIN